MGRLGKAIVLFFKGQKGNKQNFIDGLFYYKLKIWIFELLSMIQ
jgi:hypothetical protein